MNESPSARLDRLVGALEELSSQESCLAAQCSWEEAMRIQSRFAGIVEAICPLADSLAREGFLSEATKQRVREIMQRQRRTAEQVRRRLEDSRARLDETGAAASRISMIRPVYGSSRGATAVKPSLLDSSG